MKSIKKIAVIAAGLMLSSITPATAALINIEDHGTYFSDLTNGLDWLDVTQSVNRSYNDVSSQFGLGGDYEGWRYATSAEFGTMVDTVTGHVSGVTGIVQSGTTLSEGDTSYRELISLLGDTLDSFYQNFYSTSFCDQPNSQCIDGDLVYTRGILSEIRSTVLGGIHVNGFIGDDDRNSSGLDWLDWINTNNSSLDYEANYTIGSFLVRDTTLENATSVPEPSSLALLTLGMLGFAATSYRRREKMKEENSSALFA